MNSYLPDRQHIESIRRALWAEPGLGQAAVMVGAGMSRNADRVRPGRAAMPTWEDLIFVMIDRLYPPSPATEHRRADLKGQAKATSAAQRLAEEFTAAFGRPALDDLVLHAIPDEDFTPNQLHRLLLELPWADVLTTNYDTLLERAAFGGLGQRYSAVRIAEEISAAVRPRIVKLHGSFPSSRPFILTEEDFRTYQRRFAPFVNLAQQTVMENIVCLIGFSGDDPNFLYWTGWVRDNLGTYAPKVYLCGLLDLSDSQRVLLQTRNVVPIDLTPLFPLEQFPDAGRRHRLALEWFLLSLRNGRPYEALDWPNPPAVGEGQYPHLPELLPPPTGNKPLLERWFPQQRRGVAKMPEPSVQNLLDELSKWRHNRSVYPGWLIAPDHVRETLWQHTRNWVAHFMDVRSSLSLYQELEILFELNWRLETALVPIWNDLVPAYEHVLETINPFPGEITDLPSATLVLSDTTAREQNWAVVREQWLSLALGVLRYYREERKADAFEAMHARLGSLGEQVGDARARWCYERCLFALGEMDDESAVLALGQWPAKTHDVFWSVRKAAVLAEIGRTDQALELSGIALAKLREGFSDSTVHIPSLSREGWALLLALALRSNRRWRGVPVDESADREEVRRRVSQLKKYGCSPYEINDYFKSRLEQPLPQPKPQAVTAPGFEPGTYSLTLHVGSDFGAKLLPAYQYFRLVEEVAQPPNFGNISISKDTLKRVAEWFSEHDPVRTQAIMLRLRDDKLVEGYVSRHRVAALRPETVLGLRMIARRAIDQSLPRVPARVRPETDEEIRASSRLKCAMELISRACVRETEDQLNESWELACTLYRHPAIRTGLRFDGPLRHFFTSLIESTPETLLLQRLPTLFRLPVAGETDFPVSVADQWPDPATMAAQRFEIAVWQRPPANWAAVKRTLFEVARSSDAHAKRAAFVRLLRLNDLGALSASERDQLAQIFWAPVADGPGLPMEAWQFRTPWFALSLPQPNRQIGANERVRQHILTTQLGEIHGGMVPPESYFDLILDATDDQDRESRSPPHRWYVQWTSADVRRLLETIRAWWENHGRRIAEEVRQVSWRRARDSAAVRSFMNRLWEVVRIVIIPRIGRGGSGPTALMELVAEMRSAGLAVGAVLPATLILRPNTLGEVVSGLRQEFANPEIEYYLSALRGIVYWVDKSGGNRRRRRTVLPRVPPDLLREMSMAVALRRPESLGLSLDFAYSVLRRLGEGADRQFVRNLLIGLDYLFGETAYQETASLTGRCPYEEVPGIRCLAARLAKCLSDCGYDTDPIIQRWTEAILADPLPEVRRIATEPGIT